MSVTLSPVQSGKPRNGNTGRSGELSSTITKKEISIVERAEFYAVQIKNNEKNYGYMKAFQMNLWEFNEEIEKSIREKNSPFTYVDDGKGRIYDDDSAAFRIYAMNQFLRELFKRPVEQKLTKEQDIISAQWNKIKKAWDGDVRRSREALIDLAQRDENVQSENQEGSVSDVQQVPNVQPQQPNALQVNAKDSVEPVPKPVVPLNASPNGQGGDRVNSGGSTRNAAVVAIVNEFQKDENGDIAEEEDESESGDEAENIPIKNEKQRKFNNEKYMDKVMHDTIFSSLKYIGYSYDNSKKKFFKNNSEKVENSFIRTNPEDGVSSIERNPKKQKEINKNDRKNNSNTLNNNSENKYSSTNNNNINNATIVQTPSIQNTKSKEVNRENNIRNKKEKSQKDKIPIIETNEKNNQINNSNISTNNNVENKNLNKVTNDEMNVEATNNANINKRKKSKKSKRQNERHENMKEQRKKRNEQKLQNIKYIKKTGRLTSSLISKKTQKSTLQNLENNKIAPNKNALKDAAKFGR